MAGGPDKPTLFLWQIYCISDDSLLASGACRIPYIFFPKVKVVKGQKHAGSIGPVLSKVIVTHKTV